MIPRQVLLPLLAGVLSACMAFSEASAGETWLYMNSDCGDFQGGGGQFYYNGTNTPYSLSGFGGEAMLEMGGWELNFGVNLPAFTNGMYSAVLQFFPEGTNSIDIIGSQSCVGGFGTFQVLEAAYDTNGNLVTLWLTFDQSCDGVSSELHGEMRVNAHPPLIVNAPRNTSIVNDQLLGFVVTAASTNGGRVTLAASGVPNGASFVDNGDSTATFGWTPTWSQIGNATMVVHAADTHGLATDATVDIAVLPQNGVTSLLVDRQPNGGTNITQLASLTPTNGPITVNGFRGVSINYHGNFIPNWNLSFASADCSPLTTGTYVDASSFFTLSTNQGSSSVSGSADNCGGSAGVFIVKQIVRDFPSGILAFRASFEQDCGDILFGEINDNAEAPVILQAPYTASMAAGQTLTGTVAAADAHGRPLTLTASDLPDGSAFQDNGTGTGMFTWTPDASQFGIFYVRYRADNGAGEFDTAQTRITVFPPAVSVYGVEKGRILYQKKTGLPQPIKRGLGYEFSAFTDSPTNGTIRSVTLHLPSGHVQPLSLQSDARSFGYGATLTNQFTLDSVFPNGVYEFEVTTTQTNVLMPTVNLPSGTYPSAPHVNNWSAGQFVNAAQDFVLTWDAFPGGTTNDSVEVGIYDSTGSLLLFQTPTIGEKGALDGTSTATVIPSNTLQVGQTYVGLLGFVHAANIDRVSYPLGTGYGLLTSITGFQMKTTSVSRRGSGKVQFSSARYIVNDNVENATISLFRTGGNTLPLSVQYATSDATARAGVDYTAVSGTLVFTNGDTSHVFTVPITPNAASNGTKTVTLLLSPIVNGAPHGTRKATLYIQGN